MKILEGPCYRENCSGPMKYVDGIYICESCGLGSTKEAYVSWYEEGSGINDDPEDTYEGVPGYDELYDLDGDYIYCPLCIKYYTPLKKYEGAVTCPRCGYVMNEREFKNYIGDV